MRGEHRGTRRLSAPPRVLLREAMGTPRDFLGKLRRTATVVYLYGREDRVLPRLSRLFELGHIDVLPTRLQRMVGAVDMLRFFIVPAAEDYYGKKGINFRFHTLLRFLDDPASVIDPTGFNSTRDAIIGHVLQVVHANPHYDLQLLDSFADGLEEMERQTRAILDGTHPRTASIRAVVEDPEYHARLLAYVLAYRRDPTAPPPLRDNIHDNPVFAEVERTFGNVHSAMRYFATMPTTLRGAYRHLREVRRFPGPAPEPVRHPEPAPAPTHNPILVTPMAPIVAVVETPGETPVLVEAMPVQVVEVPREPELVVVPEPEPEAVGS
jgi:hypothetical protein